MYRCMMYINQSFSTQCGLISFSTQCGLVSVY